WGSSVVDPILVCRPRRRGGKAPVGVSLSVGCFASWSFLPPGAEAPGLRRHFFQARRILASPALFGRLTLNPGYRQPGWLLQADLSVVGTARPGASPGGLVRHRSISARDGRPRRSTS